MFTIALTIFIIGILVRFAIKLAMKSRMKNSLGREVGDHEITSLNSWMKVAENEDRDKRRQQ